MLVPEEGIILSALKFKESSLIVKVFTPKYGVLTFLEKGVRSSKTKGRSGWFQPGVILQFIMNYQEHKSMHYFREYKLGYIYESNLYDIKKFSVLQFAIELLGKCLHDHQDDEQLYEMVKNQLIALDKNPFNSNFHIEFVIELMKFLGVYPQCNYSKSQEYFNMKDGNFESYQNKNYTLSKEDSLLLSQVLNNKTALKNGRERAKVLELLIQYLQFHIENFKGVKSLDVLKVIFG